MGMFSRKKKEQEKVNFVEEFDYNATKEFLEQNRKPEKRDFLKIPEWMKPEFDEDGNYAEKPDDMLPLYDVRQQQKFYREGKLAIGTIVQANVLIFEPGDFDVGGVMLYTTEPYFIENPRELQFMAHDLFATKGEQGYAPSIQKLADILASEVDRLFRYRIPRDVVSNTEVYCTTVMFSRDHLPGGVINSDITYPMLVLEDSEPDAIVLPYWRWK